MIKSEKGTLEIRANGTQLIFELNHIFEGIYNDAPELLLAAVTAWSEYFIDHLDKLDSHKVVAAHDFIKELVDEMEGDDE